MLVEMMRDRRPKSRDSQLRESLSFWGLENQEVEREEEVDDDDADDEDDDGCGCGRCRSRCGCEDGEVDSAQGI